MTDEELSVFLNQIDPNPPIQFMIVEENPPNFANDLAMFRLRHALSKLPPQSDPMDRVQSAASAGGTLFTKILTGEEVDVWVGSMGSELVLDVRTTPENRFLVLPFGSHVLGVYLKRGQWEIDFPEFLPEAKGITCSVYRAHPNSLELGTRLLNRSLAR